MVYIKKMQYNVANISADDELRCNIAFAIHKNMTRHTRGFLSLGHSAISLDLKKKLT